MAIHQFYQVIPTHILLAYLREELAKTDAMLRRARGDETLILQGRAALLEQLLNLPDILTTIEEADEEAKRMKKENKGASQDT